MHVTPVRKACRLEGRACNSRDRLGHRQTMSTRRADDIFSQRGKRAKAKLSLNLQTFYSYWSSSDLRYLKNKFTLEQCDDVTGEIQIHLFVCGQEPNFILLKAGWILKATLTCIRFDLKWRKSKCCATEFVTRGKFGVHVTMICLVL